MTRSTLLSCLLATLPPLALACAEPGTSGPARAKPAPRPAPPPPETSPPPAPEQSVGDCTADIDCATTALPTTPITSESDCCFPGCQKRVAPRAQVDELKAAFGATCKAVLCAPQSCTSQTEPVPVCREGFCVAQP